MFQTALYTCLALVAFAANSILCRLALATGSIDPALFTLIRLAAGAATLSALVPLRSTRPHGPSAWTGGGLLFLYAVPFGFAYRHLTAGTGALLLFGAVQVTMLLASFRGGRRPAPGQWLGLAFAFGGLTYLLAPGITAPSPLGAALMLGAGVAWGLYTLLGRVASDPLAATAANFVRSLPWALLVTVVMAPRQFPQLRGILLATASGAIASGFGYVLWYRALRGLATLSAGVVQLAVPVLASLGGLLLLQESLTWRLLLATLLVLGGIALALTAAARRRLTTE